MANVGVYPFSPAAGTLVSNVRVLVGDTDPTPIIPIPEDPETPEDTDPTPVAPATTGEYMWYSDAEIEALGPLMRNNARRVAIWVLSQVAISESLMLKKWKTDDLSVDGPAISAAIERTIARLAKEADAEDARDDEYFDLVGAADSCGCRHGEASTWVVGCNHRLGF